MLLLLLVGAAVVVSGAELNLKQAIITKVTNVVLGNSMFKN